jgi:dipeptidyl aminopeptidase/acylaminoacyl peptidase
MPENDPFQTRVVYTLPGMEQAPVRKDLTYKTVGSVELKLDVYYPPDFQEGSQRPAVIFIHGEGPPDILKNAKNWGQYVSWGQLAAASGLVAATFNHRSSEWFTRLYEVASDVDDLLNYVRQNAASLNIDSNQIGIWVCSGGTPVGLRAAMRESATFVRCIVVYYGRTNLEIMREKISPEANDETLREFSPELHLGGNTAPLLLVRAGQDSLPKVNEAIDRFLAAAIAHNVAIEFINHPGGQHAFDIFDDDERSRSIVRRTLAFLQEHLLEKR